jgi:hypothetical protein
MPEAKELGITLMTQPEFRNFLETGEIPISA